MALGGGARLYCLTSLSEAIEGLKGTFSRARPPADGWGRRLMMMIMRVESVEERPGWGEHV